MVDVQISTNVEPYTGTEPAFVPSAVPPVVIPLVPTAPAPSAPGVIPGVPVPPDLPSIRPPGTIFGENERILMIDIEATGVKPWEDRIFSIGLKDPLQPDEPELVLWNEDEPTILHKLFDHFNQGNFNKLVGYGLSYDTRFVFARAMRWRISAGEFFSADTEDLMDTLRKVYDHYILTYNKPGKLEEWTMAMLGVPKTTTIAELLKAFERRDWPTIIEYSSRDIKLVYSLFVLARTVMRIPYSTTPFGEAPAGGGGQSVITNDDGQANVTPITQNTGAAPAQCPTCLNRFDIPAGQNSAACPVCGTNVTR